MSLLLIGSSRWPEPPGRRHHDHDHQYDQSDESDESNDDAEDNLVDEAHEVVVGPSSLVEFLKIFQYSCLNKFTFE